MDNFVKKNSLEQMRVIEQLIERKGDGWPRVERLRQCMAAWIVGENNPNSPNYRRDGAKADFNMDGDAARVVAAYGDAEAVRAMAATGADFNAEDENGRTAAHFVAWNSDVEAIRAVADAGADLNARTKTGRTVAHFVGKGVEGYEPECIHTLAALGVDFNARDEEGETPAHSLTGCFVPPKIIRAFAEAGADFTLEGGRRYEEFVPIQRITNVNDEEVHRIVAEITYGQAEEKLSHMTAQLVDQQDMAEVERLRGLMRTSSRMLSRAQEQDDLGQHASPQVHQEKEAADTSDDFSL